jgi:hypothetical protein
MTTPKSESINTVSEPQPLGYDHSLGGNLHFPLPAISATPLRISDSPIPESKAPPGKFTLADAGQMQLYLNYAREHRTHEGENPPVGLILCAEKDESVARYALDNLGSKVLAREYQMLLPNEKLLAAELEKTRHQLASCR